MSGDPAQSASVPNLRLGGSRPAVTRISRKVLIGVGGVAAIGVFALGFWALQSNRKAAPAQLYNTDSKNVAEGVGRLPHDYTGLPRDIPKLGPPLPGDLGKPILNAQMQQNNSADTEQQRLMQERESARTSHLFIGASPASTDATTAAAAGAANSPSAATADSKSKDADPNLQAQKLDFLKTAGDRQSTSSERLEQPASPYVLQAGSVISAALITGIRSDLPGQLTAQVTEDVYDSPTGRILLIPQGSKLLGQYNSQVSFSQQRLQLVWTRLILPDGASILLDRQEGGDAEGYSGLSDGVDNHWGALLKAAVLSTVLSVGSEAGTSNSENNLAQAIRSGASTSISQTGQQVVEHSLNVQPTLTIRPGFPVRVIVSRDLILTPLKR